MVIVCAVSDGYYLPALLTLLYVSRLLSSSCLTPTLPASASLLLPVIYTTSLTLLLTLSFALLCHIHVHSLCFTRLYYPAVLIFSPFLSLLAVFIFHLLPIAVSLLPCWFMCNSLICKAANTAEQVTSLPVSHYKCNNWDWNLLFAGLMLWFGVGS